MLLWRRNWHSSVLRLGLWHLSSLRKSFTAIPLSGLRHGCWGVVQDRNLWAWSGITSWIDSLPFPGWHEQSCGPNCCIFALVPIFMVFSPFKLHWPEKDAGAGAWESSSECHEPGGSWLLVLDPGVRNLFPRGSETDRSWAFQQDAACRWISASHVQQAPCVSRMPSLLGLTWAESCWMILSQIMLVCLTSVA